MEEAIEAVQRMQDYIAANADRSVTPADLARAALYSPWYSYRLFTRYLRMTPADYIRRLRLSRSALRLRDEPGARVLDVALASGYESADGYQRAFLREFGLSPGAYAARPVPIRLFIPYGIRAVSARKEEREMEKSKTVFVQEELRSARKAIIRRGVKAEEYFAYCEEVGCDVWGLLMSMKSLCGEPVCMWLPTRYIAQGTSKYVQGVEAPTDYDGPVPEGFDVIDLPECLYLRFTGEPFAEEDYQDAIGQVWNAIERYQPERFGYAWDKENPRIQFAPVGERGYIELMPVTRLA